MTGANSKATTKGKPRGKPFTKGDKRINLKGAPKRGTSMADAYDWALSLRPEQVSEILKLNGANDLSRQYDSMPRGIQLRLLVALRITAAVMFEPQPGLVNHIVDRLDGPVKQEEEHSGKVEILVRYEDRDHPAESAPSATDDQIEG